MDPRQTPPNPTVQIERWLRQCPIFLDWPTDRLRELAGSARMRRYRRRTPLVVRQSHRRDIFLIVSGSIEVAATNAAGEKYIQSMLGPGQVTRLVQLLDDAPTIFAFYAREDSQIIRIPGAIMRRILDAAPALWQSIAQLMLRRFLLTADILQSQVLSSVRRRMAITLINMAGHYGEQQIGAGSAALRISQTDLANMLGVSRQTIARELARLKDEGILGDNKGYRLITLLDIPGLLRIAKEDLAMLRNTGA